MQVYLNGRFIPEAEACVSVHDRGFLYGDGLFETIRVYGGEPFLWTDHLRRLAHGCSVLRIPLPLTSSEIRRVVREQLQRNGLQEAIVRISVSRGIGSRGYSPRGAEHPTFCIATFPAADRLALNWRLVISGVRLPDADPFAAFKHSNKLRQVMARAEADEKGADEALLLNDSGQVVEGSTTNLFWIQKNAVFTPMLSGILSGITRNYVLKLCAFLGIPAAEKSIVPKRLLQADGVFVTSSGIEIMEVGEIEGTKIKRSPIVAQLKEHYRKSPA